MNKKNFFWNMIGSILNAFSTLVFTIVTTRISGEEYGGIMGLAIGISFVLTTIGLFEIRPFQSTDISEEFCFADYLGHRIITCSIMGIVLIIYVNISGFSGIKAATVVGVGLFKMVDSISDVFQGMFQQRGRLDLAGKALTIRICMSMLGFIGMLYFSGNLVYSCMLMVAVSVVCIVCFDIRNARQFCVIHPAFSKGKLKRLTKSCFPLFLISFISMYLTNAGKFEVDRYCPELQAAWNALFVLAAVINLFSIFAFRPLLTILAEKWQKKELKIFALITIGLCAWITVVMIAALGAGYLAGIPLLNFMYGMNLNKYKITFLIILTGGGFSAFATLLYYINTVIRLQKYILKCDCIVFLTAIFVMPFLVKRYFLNGAALGYLAIMVFRGILLLFILLIKYVKEYRIETIAN